MRPPALRLLQTLSVRARAVLGLCLFEVAFYFAYTYGMAFSQSLSAPFWFPDTVLLTALLLTRRRYWWLLLFTTLPIRLLVSVPASIPIWFLLAAFANDCLKAMASACLIRFLVPDLSTIGGPREFGRFVVVAVITMPQLSALVGAACRSLLGYPFWPAWTQWFLGNALTNLVLTSTVLLWLPFCRRPSGRWPSGRIVEGTLLVLGLSVTASFALGGSLDVAGASRALLYTPVPFLLWAAIRFGPHGAAGALAIMACQAVWSAAHGHGIFSAGSVAENVLAVQLFLFVIGVPMLLLAAVAQDRMRVGAALRASEARMSLATEAAEMSLWVWNVPTDEVWITDKRRDLDGASSSERVTYAAFMDRVDPEDRALVSDGIERALGGDDLFESEYRIAGSDEAVRWVASRGRCIRAPNGAVTQFMGVSLDITARKRVEEAMQGLAQSARLALLGELTASIAHEISQPLAAILCNARSGELLLEGDAPALEELREILADIRKDDLRASEVIQRVRELVVQRKSRRALMDVNDVVKDVLRLVAVEAPTRGIALQADLASGLPPVTGDRIQVQEALLNLIVNGMDAMKGNPPGRRQLRVSTAYEADEWVTLSVSDEGHGIPAERLPRIFEAFFTTKEQGMGLGLALARSIAELHRGHIRAENNPEAGATFRLSLPRDGGGSPLESK